MISERTLVLLALLVETLRKDLSVAIQQRGEMLDPIPCAHGLNQYTNWCRLLRTLECDRFTPPPYVSEYRGEEPTEAMAEPCRDR